MSIAIIHVQIYTTIDFFSSSFFITSILHTVLLESAQNKAVYQYHMVSEMTTRLLVIPNVFKIV